MHRELAGATQLGERVGWHAGAVGRRVGRVEWRGGAGRERQPAASGNFTLDASLSVSGSAGGRLKVMRANVRCAASLQQLASGATVSAGQLALSVSSATAAHQESGSGVLVVAAAASLSGAFSVSGSVLVQANTSLSGSSSITSALR